jgi:hypothetical protein
MSRAGQPRGPRDCRRPRFIVGSRRACALLLASGPALHRSGADNPDADCRLRVRNPLGAGALPRGAGERFDIKPNRLAADTACGSGPNLNWLVKDKDIAPHIPVIDKSKREDGTFNREDFSFDKARKLCVCPANKTLTTTGTVIDDGRRFVVSPAHPTVWAACSRCDAVQRRLSSESPAASTKSARCCPRAGQDRSIRTITSRRKRVEMLFAHRKRILRRLRSRGPCGAQATQPLRKTYAGSPSWGPDRRQQPLPMGRSPSHTSVSKRRNCRSQWKRPRPAA